MDTKVVQLLSLAADAQCFDPQWPDALTEVVGEDELTEDDLEFVSAAQGYSRFLSMLPPQGTYL